MSSRSRVRQAVVSSILALAGLGALAAEALADYPAEVRADNPTGYFRMADSDATMRNEIVGHGDGNHRNSPLLGVESALPNDTGDRSVGYRDGANSDRSEYLVGTISRFSIEFFMKTNQTVGAGVSNWYDGFGLVDGEQSGVTSDFGTALVGGGKVGFGVGSPDITIKSAKVVNDFQWHHVVATYDSTNGDMKLYVDGQLEVESSSHPGGSRNATVGITIGSLHTNILEFAGAIDEVAFYHHVLPASDVTQHYAARNDSTPAPPPPPDGRLAFSGFGGGTGTITAPGISCSIVGGPFPAGDCDEFYPAGTFVNFEAVPNADSRFSIWQEGIETDTLCVSNPACGLTIQSDKVDALFGVFYLRSQPLGNALLPSLAGTADQLASAYDQSVDPGKKGSISTPNAILQRPDIQTADGGGVVGVGWPSDKTGLIGSDGASIVAAGAGNFKTKSPEPPSLIGSDGGSLIGSDGATLVGADGATLVGGAGNTLVGNGGNLRPADRDGSPRSTHKAPKQKYKIFALGGYTVTDLDAQGNYEAVFTLTNKGKQIIKTLGQANRRLGNAQEIPLNATFLEVVQPEDNRGTGGAFIKFKIN